MKREDLIALIRSKARVSGHDAWEGGYYHLSNADEIADAILALGLAQTQQVPVAWQYRVMYDRWHARKDEWCEWRDAGKRYFNKVNAEIAAGATRVQIRALCVADSSTSHESAPRVPKVRTSHHRNKEEAERLQKLVDKRFSVADTETDRCICQDKHRRGYCTEPGCPYSSPERAGK